MHGTLNSLGSYIARRLMQAIHLIGGTIAVNFRLIHLASYLAFAGAAVHGLLSGTDSPLASVQMMYFVTAMSVVFLTIYRILMGVFNRWRRPAVQRAGAR